MTEAKEVPQVQNTQEPRNVGWAEKLRDVLEGSPYVHLLGMLGAAITFLVVPATFYQLMVEFNHREEERKAQTEERIERAWTRLLARAGGDIGKGQALNLLLNESSSLRSVDLSCQAIGDWDPINAICRNAPVFTDVTFDYRSGLGSFDEFSDPTFILKELNNKKKRFTSDMEILDFSSVVLVNPTIEGRRLNDTVLHKSKIQAGSLLGTQWFGQSPNIAIDGTDLRFVRFFWSDVSQAKIENSDLSGAMFATDDDRFLKGNENVAWADMPPRLMTKDGVKPMTVDFLKRVTFCDPNKREETFVVGLESKFFLLHLPFEPDERYDLYRLPSSPLDRNYDCVEMSLGDAAKMYSDRYPPLLEPK